MNQLLIKGFITRGQDEKTLVLSPTQQELNELFETLQKIDKQEFRTNTFLAIRSPVYGGGPCTKGKVSFAVHTDGSVYECVSGSHEFGNIRENNLKDIFSLNNLKVKDFYSGTNFCDACSLNYRPGL